MPNIQSAKKRMKQAVVRQARNRNAKSELKTLARKVVTAATAGKVEDAEAGFRTAAKRLDQVASKGIIHKNAAARKKSRLAAAIKKAKAGKS